VRQRHCLLYEAIAGTSAYRAVGDINLTTEPYWLAFDFVDGGTLEALMRAAPLDWQESLNWFRPIVEAVAAVHRINIVHRDLKPANILLTTDGVPKIADFGIGKITAENETVMRRLVTNILY
jgi:serine/threonine protein kinase